MRRVAEAIVFGGLATAVHAAALVGLADGSGLPGGAGDGGKAILTVAAAPPSVVRRFEEWDRSPDVGEAKPALTSPEVSALRPDAPAEASRPDRPADPSPLSDLRRDAAVPAIPEPLPPLPAPVPSTVPSGLPAEPLPGATDPPVARAETRHPYDGGAERSKPAAPRPDAAFEPDAVAPPPAAPQAARRAAGDRGGTARGHSAPAETASRRTSDTATLMADWSARIRARIERRKAAPGGRWEPGGALLRIRVSAEGTLLQLGLVRSSGDKRLDDAAVSAVRRAGPFPAAPSGLPYDAVTFDVPVAFAR